MNEVSKLTADAQTPTNEAASTQSFEADVSRLLHLMVHSVYSDRDIFVRELVWAYRARGCCVGALSRDRLESLLISRTFNYDIAARGDVAARSSSKTLKSGPAAEVDTERLFLCCALYYFSNTER